MSLRQTGFDPHTSAFAADQRGIPIRFLRFGFVTYGPAQLQRIGKSNGMLRQER